VPSADVASSTNGAGLDPVAVAAGSIAHETSSAEDGDGAADLTF